ncbi:MAG: hypothetical protein ACREBR_03105, partial [bacterium]
KVTDLAATVLHSPTKRYATRAAAASVTEMPASPLQIPGVPDHELALTPRRSAIRKFAYSNTEKQAETTRKRAKQGPPLKKLEMSSVFLFIRLTKTSCLSLASPQLFLAHLTKD